jgi:hypothetical protein
MCAIRYSGGDVVVYRLTWCLWGIKPDMCHKVQWLGCGCIKINLVFMRYKTRYVPQGSGGDVVVYRLT